ncbi:MAG: TrmH family RNA methyltransferase [Bdellovibrionales bacterium]
MQRLGPLLTDERRARLQQVAQNRTTQVVSVLENIYDRGNVSAVMRSAESFGFLKMHLVEAPGARFKAANRVTKGADKWLDVQVHPTAEATAHTLREQGYQIWVTDLETNDSLDNLDWTKPLAFVLGNEKDGVSPEMKRLADGRFRIPMVGFSQSFNISVAGALIFYRAHLELLKQQNGARVTDEQVEKILANYYLRCFDNPEVLLLGGRDRI